MDEHIQMGFKKYIYNYDVSWRRRFGVVLAPPAATKGCFLFLQLTLL